MRILMLFIAFSVFLSILWNEDQKTTTEKIFTAYVKDSIPIEVYLVYDREELPIKYYSNVITPVCDDGVCYLMEIEVYWDLLGNFLDYEEVLGSPLTKFDHIEFTNEDHEKMKKILSDKTSLLANYNMEDLIDNSIQITSKFELDGVSGATHKSIENEVVGGAVYSTYTLWHIVNGKVAEQIVHHTESILNDSLLVQMLESNNYHHQYYALNNIQVENKKFLPHIIRLISKGDSYVPFFAIEKLPKNIWTLPKYQEKLVSLLKDVDFKIQNGLLNNLKEIPLSKGALNRLITSIGILSENQVIKALEILEKNRANIPERSLLQLSNLLYSENSEISTMASHLIKQSR